MKAEIIKYVKEFSTIIVIGFLIGLFVHFGFNTAKLIWPMPPVEWSVTVSE